MTDNSQSGLEIGSLSIDQGTVTVKTFYNGECYVTNLKHPSYNNGLETLVDTYGKSFNTAGTGHKKWVRFAYNFSLENLMPVQQHKMPDLSKEVCVRVNTVRISMHALLKILYNYAGDQNVKFTPSQKYPYEVHLSLSYPNKNAGSCLYDLNKMEAWGLTPKWFAILQEVRAELQDHRETKDEENACSGQRKTT